MQTMQISFSPGTLGGPTQLNIVKREFANLKKQFDDYVPVTNVMTNVQAYRRIALALQNLFQQYQHIRNFAPDLFYDIQQLVNALEIEIQTLSGKQSERASTRALPTYKDHAGTKDGDVFGAVQILDNRAYKINQIMRQGFALVMKEIKARTFGKRQFALDKLESIMDALRKLLIDYQNAIAKLELEKDPLYGSRFFADFQNREQKLINQVEMFIKQKIEPELAKISTR